VGRQRINLRYAVVGHILGKSGSPSVGAMCRTVTDGSSVSQSQADCRSGCRRTQSRASATRDCHAPRSAEDKWCSVRGPEALIGAHNAPAGATRSKKASRPRAQAGGSAEKRSAAAPCPAARPVRATRAAASAPRQRPRRRGRGGALASSADTASHGRRVMTARAALAPPGRDSCTSGTGRGQAR